MKELRIEKGAQIVFLPFSEGLVVAVYGEALLKSKCTIVMEVCRPPMGLRRKLLHLDLWPVEKIRWWQWKRKKERRDRALEAISKPKLVPAYSLFQQRLIGRSMGEI
jgi:hypothetical protein